MSSRKLLKVRTGCETCRQRKVKCDEARPACQRCNRSSRQCLGYAKTAYDHRTRSSANHIAILPLHLALPQSPSTYSSWALNDIERRAFDNYAALGQALMPFSCACQEYWVNVLLRSCHRSRGVLHGILAFSLLYDESRDMAAGQLPKPMRTNTVLHYEMLAYRSMIQCKNTLEVVHAASIFASIAYVVGERTEAIRHLFHSIVLADGVASSNKRANVQSELPPCHARFLDMGPAIRGYLNVLSPVIESDSALDGDGVGSGYRDKIDTWSWWLMVTGIQIDCPDASQVCRRAGDDSTLYESICSFVIEADRSWGRAITKRASARLYERQTALLILVDACLESLRPGGCKSSFVDVTRAELYVKHTVWKLCLASCLTRTMYAPESCVEILQEMVTAMKEIRAGVGLRPILAMTANLLALLKWPPMHMARMAPSSLRLSTMAHSVKMTPLPATVY